MPVALSLSDPAVFIVSNCGQVGLGLDFYTVDSPGTLLNYQVADILCRYRTSRGVLPFFVMGFKTLAERSDAGTIGKEELCPKET